jgi:16S rRNA processing protein RimM
VSEFAQDDLITIAQIVRPHGLKGELLAEIVTDFPDRFADLKRVFIVCPRLTPQPVDLEDYWFHQGRVVLKFSGCDDRNRAEELRGAIVQIPLAESVELPAGSYFEFQLIGCQAYTDQNELLGEVTEIMHTGAAPILVLKSQKGKEHLIPLAEEICQQIDIEKKKIIIFPPDGLLDL